jgi:hypothetical protein
VSASGRIWKVSSVFVTPDRADSSLRFGRLDWSLGVESVFSVMAILLFGRLLVGAAKNPTRCPASLIANSTIGQSTLLNLFETCCQIELPDSH